MSEKEISMYLPHFSSVVDVSVNLALIKLNLNHFCTEVRFDSFLSNGFITMAVINPPERILAKRTSVYCCIMTRGIPCWSLWKLSRSPKLVMTYYKFITKQ